MAARHSRQRSRGAGREVSGLFASLLASTALRALAAFAAVLLAQHWGSPAERDTLVATLPLVAAVMAATAGLGCGCSVVVAQHLGRGDDAQTSASVHTAVALSGAIGLACSVAGLLGVEPLLRLLGVSNLLSTQAVSFACAYLGSSVLAALHTTCSMLLRATGKNARPVVASLVACALGIAANIALVCLVGMGVHAAAIAAAASSLVGFAFCARGLARLNGACRLRVSRIRITWSIARDMLAASLPLAAQGAALALVLCMPEPLAGSFGVEVAAAWRSSQLLGLPVAATVEALSCAVSLACAKAFGAGAYDRMRRCLGAAVVISLVVVAASEGVAYALLATTPAHAVVRQLTMTLALATLPAYALFALTEDVSGVIRGSGQSLRPAMAAVTGTYVLPAVWMRLVVPLRPTVVAMLAARPLSWGATAIAMAVYYRHGRWLAPALRRARHRRMREE